MSISLVPKESSRSPCLPIRSYLQETQLSHRQKLRNSSTGKILLKKLFSFIKNLKHIFIPYPLASSIMRAQAVNMKIVVKPTRNSQEALSTQNQIILKYFQCRAGPNSWFPIRVLITKQRGEPTKRIARGKFQFRLCGSRRKDVLRSLNLSLSSALISIPKFIPEFSFDKYPQIPTPLSRH